MSAAVAERECLGRELYKFDEILISKFLLFSLSSFSISVLLNLTSTRSCLFTHTLSLPSCSISFSHLMYALALLLLSAMAPSEFGQLWIRTEVLRNECPIQQRNWGGVWGRAWDRGRGRGRGCITQVSDKVEPSEEFFRSESTSILYKVMQNRFFFYFHSFSSPSLNLVKLHRNRFKILDRFHSFHSSKLYFCFYFHVFSSVRKV